MVSALQWLASPYNVFNIPIKVLKLFIIFQLMKTLLLVGVAKITGDNEKKIQ